MEPVIFICSNLHVQCSFDIFIHSFNLCLWIFLFEFVTIRCTAPSKSTHKTLIVAKEKLVRAYYLAHQFRRTCHIIAAACPIRNVQTFARIPFSDTLARIMFALKNRFTRFISERFFFLSDFLAQSHKTPDHVHFSTLALCVCVKMFSFNFRSMKNRGDTSGMELPEHRRYNRHRSANSTNWHWFEWPAKNFVVSLRLMRTARLISRREMLELNTIEAILNECRFVSFSH